MVPSLLTYLYRNQELSIIYKITTLWFSWWGIERWQLQVPSDQIVDSSCSVPLLSTCILNEPRPWDQAIAVEQSFEGELKKPSQSVGDSSVIVHNCNHGESCQHDGPFFPLPRAVCTKLPMCPPQNPFGLVPWKPKPYPAVIFYQHVSQGPHCRAPHY